MRRRPARISRSRCSSSSTSREDVELPANTLIAQTPGCCSRAWMGRPILMWNQRGQPRQNVAGGKLSLALSKQFPGSKLKPSFCDEDNFMSTSNVKEEAKRLIEKLPENVTWDDLMHEIYVRQSIEMGLADSQAGRVKDVAEVRAKFGLES